jgi:hypothetical protein
MNKSSYDISVPVVTYKKSEYWIAYTPALKTFGYSRTSEKEALKDFDRAVETFFWAQEKLGSLENALENLGWKRIHSERHQPKHFNMSLGNLIPGRTANKTERLIKIPA